MRKFTRGAMVLAAAAGLASGTAAFAHHSFAAEFDGILKYVGQLESLTLDTAGAPSAGALRNVFREDGAPHESGKYTEKLAGAFPQREGDALSVKQIISHD